MKYTSKKLKDFDDLPALLCVGDLERIFPLSRAGIYNLVGSTGFPAVRVGRRIIIPKDDLIAWIKSQKGA